MVAGGRVAPGCAQGVAGKCSRSCLWPCRRQQRKAAAVTQVGGPRAINLRPTGHCRAARRRQLGDVGPTQAAGPRHKVATAACQQSSCTSRCKTLPHFKLRRKWDMAEESWTWATWLPIGIASLALIISIGTALATWWAPQVAARLAEGLRTASARADLKRSVFLTLMQQRALPFTEEAVQAFNAIDVVFVDAPAVRDKSLDSSSQELSRNLGDDD
jgi:hypothetical protein